MPRKNSLEGHMVHAIIPQGDQFQAQGAMELPANFQQLSPRARRQICTERIQQNAPHFAFDRANLPKRIVEPLFSVETDGLSPQALGIGGGAAGVGIEKAAKFFMDTPRGLGTPRGVVPKMDGLSLVPILSFLGGAIGGFFAAKSYTQFARELRGKILESFEAIEDEDTNAQQLEEKANEAIEKFEQSPLRGAFRLLNPDPMGYLYLTKGIALDSRGEHEEAKSQYQTALGFRIGDELKNKLWYLLARSCRISQYGDAQQWLALMDDKYAPLAQVESYSALHGIDQVFEDGIPVDFTCQHITFQTMIDPVRCDSNNHTFYFEMAYLEHYLQAHQNRHPVTNLLVTGPLLTDEPMAASIRAWEQTKLKD